VFPVHNDINIFIAFDAFYAHKPGDLDANAACHKAVLREACRLQRVRLYSTSMKVRIRLTYARTFVYCSLHKHSSLKKKDARKSVGDCCWQQACSHGKDRANQRHSFFVAASVCFSA
jgi:hypothetical protein